MNIRDMIPETDLPVVRGWWEKHGAIPVPEAFLPRGFVAEEGGNQIAACFLYRDEGGRLACVEYITTNPAHSFSRSSVLAVHALLRHAEERAAEMGCRAIFSFVAPGTSEERIMGRAGYSTSDQVPHRMFGKVLPVYSQPQPV